MTVMAENTSPSGTVSSSTAVCHEDLSLVEFFRFALTYPGEKQFAAFTHPEFLAGLRQLGAELLPAEPWIEIQLPESLEDLEADYVGLFDAGTPHPPCPLVESHYVKNSPVSAVLLENKLFFAHFGFEHQAGRESPDHLLVQLEFIACLDYLLEVAARSEREALELARREYLERHVLHWLPRAVEELSRTSPTVYLPFLRLLEAVLRA